MANDDDRPIALDAYEKLADAFAELAPSKSQNAFIEQPTMRELLGDVRGLRVLDAGCGPGILTVWLLDRGATVTAVDVSPRMIELARRRISGRAALVVADLAKPLIFAPTGSFDVIASSLALDYVRDWDALFREFRRVLVPAGRLAFTVQHPMGSFQWYKPPSAFGVQYVEMVWRNFGEHVVVPDYYRSFENMVNPLIEAGFKLERVVETKPVASLREVDPAAFEKYSREPTFLCFAAVGP